MFVCMITWLFSGCFSDVWSECYWTSYDPLFLEELPQTGASGKRQVDLLPDLPEGQSFLLKTFFSHMFEIV